MCRLYGFRAAEPTRLECSLVLAQNALMTQSQRDREGLTHGHGWGVAEHPDGVPLPTYRQGRAACDIGFRSSTADGRAQVGGSGAVTPPSARAANG